MQLFISRYWGFYPEKYPIITFSLAGNRDSLLKRAKPGDRIVYVATKNDNSDAEDQGRLLGMAEIGRRAIDTLSVVKKEDLPPNNWENGKLKFPVAIPMVRAWRFIHPPLLTEIMAQLKYNATNQAVEVSQEDAEKILALAYEEVTLPQIETLERERNLIDRLRPSRGIVPSSGSYEVHKEQKEEAFVYLMRFGKRDVWKLGYSTRLKERRDELNKHIPSKVTGEEWSIYRQQPTSSPQDAFALEQTLIQAITSYSLGGEMFQCPEKIIADLWRKQITAYMMGEVD
jgi:hypothetical protein